MPDVYVRATTKMDHRMWCYAAAIYTAPVGVIGGLSAALFHDVHLSTGTDTPVEVLVPRQMRRAPVPELRIIRSDVPPADVIRHSSGVRITTPARTGFDIARTLPMVEAVVAIDAMCFSRALKFGDLAGFAADHTRWPGIRAVHAALELVEPLSESPMETRLRLGLIDSGLPRPVAQFEVRDGSRLIARLDLAYPQWKIGIEYDGDQHRERDAFTADLDRQNKLRAAGWTILRFTARDVYRHPDRIAALVRSVIPS